MTIRQTDAVAVTKVRHIRMGQLWDDGIAVAEAQDETLAEFIRLAVAAYVADPNAARAALAQVRAAASISPTGG
jgi:hypothetical protein